MVAVVDRAPVRNQTGGNTVSKQSSSSGGPGLATLLTVLFVGLKLGHVIDWPWKWVLAPTWIPLALLSAAAIVAGIVYLILKWRSE